MKTKLTPGYWKADYNCMSLVYTDEAEIAHVEESDDARAISAVPELIDALHGAIKAGIPSGPAYEQAKRALTKALGPDWQNSPAMPPEVVSGEISKP